MVGHTGILSNHILQWLDRVEVLRQQVGMRGLADTRPVTGPTGLTPLEPGPLKHIAT